MGSTRRAVLPLTVVALLAACSDDAAPGVITTTDQAGRTIIVTEPAPPMTEQPTGDATTVPDPVPTTLPVPEPSEPAPVDDGATATPSRAVLTTVGMQIPSGWTVEDLGEAQAAQPQAGEVPPHLWCLVPPEDLPPVDGCAGVAVAVGPDWLPGAGGTPYRPRQANGWYAGTEPLTCPFPGEGAADPEEPQEEGGVVETDADGEPLTSTGTEIGDLAVTYETWRVRCPDGDQTFAPQLWYIPELGVLVRDYFGHPDTVTILHSLEGA